MDKLCKCGCKEGNHLKPVHLDSINEDMDICADPAHHCKKFQPAHTPQGEEKP